MKRVFICSPYAGDVERNVERARRLCKKALDEGLAPFAPHLLYPAIADDDIAEERAAGIEAGLAFLKICDEIWVDCEKRPSEGMKREIQFAGENGIQVVWLVPLNCFNFEAMRW